MNYITFILIVLAIVQFIMILIKGSKVTRQENVAKVNELIGYMDEGNFNATDVMDRNPLMIAAASHYFNNKGEPGFDEAIRHGIKVGMNINERCATGGKTPLHFALETEFGLENAKVLVEAGADVHVTDNKGKTALFYAAKEDKKKYDLIIDRVKDINYQKEDGVTALMVAVRAMKIDIINDMLERGADPKITHSGGLNCGDIAKKYGPGHIRHLHESNTEEGTHHDPTASERRRADEWNHEVKEMMRKLQCLVEDKPYKYKKFKAHGLF